MYTDRSARRGVAYLDAKNLIPEVLKVVEGWLRCDGIYQHESLAVFHVKVAHSSKLFLENCNVCPMLLLHICLWPYCASSVQDLEHALSAVHFHLLTIRVLNRGVILFNKDALEMTKRTMYLQTSGHSTLYILLLVLTCTNWTVRADLPTPPDPSTTILYSLIAAVLVLVAEVLAEKKTLCILPNSSCISLINK